MIPAKAGPNQIHVTVEHTTGIVENVLQVQVSLTEATKNIAPLDIKMIRLGAGHYVSTGATIPFPGQWRLTAKALVNDVTEEVGFGTFKVS